MGSSDQARSSRFALKRRTWIDFEGLTHHNLRDSEILEDPLGHVHLFSSPLSDTKALKTGLSFRGPAASDLALCLLENGDIVL